MIVLVAQGRVATDLPQPGQHGENRQLVASQRSPLLPQPLPGLHGVGGVELMLLFLHAHGQHRFHLGRQLPQHVPLEPPQNKGGGHPFHVAPGPPVAVFHNGAFESLPEPAVGIEKTGHEKIKNAPQLAEPVFNGGAGEGEPLAALHRLDRPGVLGVLILDILRLVQNMVSEQPALVMLDIPLEQIVGGDGHIVAHRAADGLGPLFRIPQDGQHGQLRGKAADLRLPVENQRGGTHHQGRAVVARLPGHPAAGR